ncbi:MAG: hypothetical protein ACXWQO_13795 [Bdellovibrionota bacterium]
MKTTLRLFLLLSFSASSAFAGATTTPLYEIVQKKGSYYSINYLHLLAAAPKVRAAINAKIESVVSANEEPCDEAKGSDFNGDVTEVTVLPGQLLSLKAQQEGYCAKSAHPFGETQGLVFDLKSGKQLTLESQLKDGNTAPIDALLLKQAKEENGHEGGADGCDYEQMEVHAAQFALSQGTLTVWTQFPHAMQACDAEVKLPLFQIKDLLAPGSLADQIAKAQEKN